MLTIAGLFVVGAALFQTGAADALGRRLTSIAGTSEPRAIIATMLLVALLSTVMSSTGTVAVFLPVVTALARSTGLSRARLFIPLAYAAEVGEDLAGELGVAEVLLTPRSRLLGHTLREARFRDLYQVIVLAILRHGEPIAGPTSQAKLRFGDTLLVQGTWEQIAGLRAERNDFVVLGEPRGYEGARYDSRRGPLVIAIMLAMLALITFELLPTSTAVLLAAVAIVLTGNLTMEDAYRAMSWESVVLIAAMLPMATALEKTGGMMLIAGWLTATLGPLGPLAVLAGLFLLTSLFGLFISNTATAVLMAPIAIEAAAALAVSPYPMLMTVAIAASTAFATPISSPVNTLVVGPGGYRFRDFVVVGVPLQLLLMVASVLAIPLLFPFVP